MGSVDKVNGLTGYCPWAHWTLFWLKNKMKLKAASLEIYIQISF